MVRCMGCMKEINEGLLACPHCGYIEKVGMSNGKYLPPSTILQGRYIVGEVKHETGNLIRYIGFDALLERRVFVNALLTTSQSITFNDKDVVDTFEDGGTSYVIIDYKEEYASGGIVGSTIDYPDESNGRVIETKQNYTPLIIGLVAIACILLILIAVVNNSALDSESQLAEISELYTQETEQEASEESTQECTEESPDEFTEESPDEFTEESADEFTEESADELTEESIEEVTDEPAEEQSEDVDVMAYLETLSEDEIMEFIVAALWKDVNYSTGVITGDMNEMDESYLVENSNAMVAANLLEEELVGDVVVFEGIISMIQSEYEGSYITAPYWFTLELGMEGPYTMSFEEIVNDAAQVIPSYELTDDYGTYSIANALDQDPTTTWSVPNDMHQSVNFQYSSEKKIYGVLMLNGYWKSEDTYINNGRVTQLEIHTQDDYLGGFDIDTAGYNATVAGNGVYNYMLLFDEPVTDSEINIIASNTMSGAKYSDICVSEILVIAR